MEEVIINVGMHAVFAQNVYTTDFSLEMYWDIVQNILWPKAWHEETWASWKRLSSQSKREDDSYHFRKLLGLLKLQDADARYNFSIDYHTVHKENPFSKMFLDRIWIGFSRVVMGELMVRDKVVTWLCVQVSRQSPPPHGTPWQLYYPVRCQGSVLSQIFHIHSILTNF